MGQNSGKKLQVNIRMTPDMNAWLDQLSEISGQSKTGIVEDALSLYFDDAPSILIPGRRKAVIEAWRHIKGSKGFGFDDSKTPISNEVPLGVVKSQAKKLSGISRKKK